MKRTIFMILAALVPLISTQAQSAPLDSEWIEYVETDPITDETKVILSLDAAGSNKSFWTKERLVIRATIEKMELFVVWNTMLGTDIKDFIIPGKYIDFRIGNNPAQRTYWSNSTDGQASFYLGDVSDLLQQIAKTDRFIVRCTPIGEKTITLFFNTTGLDYYLRKYQNYFPWYSSEQNVQ